MRSLLLRFVTLAAAVLLCAGAADAQVGSTTDIIMGKVLAPDSTPVVGARIEVTSNETGITRRKETNERGEFSILFPDGGGAYRLRASFLGYAPYEVAVQRQADEDRLIVNVRLSRNPQVLQAVTVRARNDANAQDRPTAGSVERNLTAAQLDRLPVDKGDLATVATLVPGVIGTGATDSTAAVFSVAGQPTNQNQITLDGLSFGSGSVPAEAVRATRVITNTYDVSRGQFTGGQVASTTRGGTNNVQGVVSYALRDPDLEFVDSSSASFGQKYQQNSINLGAGGPIVRDEAFVFGAVSLSRRTNPLSSLLAADPQTLARLGASQDSVARFLGRLAGIGVAPTLPGIPDNHLADNASALVRFDYSLGEAHTLTLRGDWRGQSQDATRISSLSVPSTGGNLRTTGGGIMLSLTSHLGRFINEGRVYQSSDRQNTEPYLAIPGGRVTVASVLDNGTRSLTTLQFGGNPSLPQLTHSRLLEATDEISWVSENGAHRYKLGGLVNEDRSSVGTIPNRYGTFYFNSLADFEANQPSQFTRTISGADRLAGSNNLALYLGDAWRRSAALQLTYGLRLEGTRFPRTPAYNPDIETLFGRRTDDAPTEVHLSPRIGFTYMPGARARNAAGGGGGGFNTASWIFRGGVGEFRGKISSNLVAGAVEATGLPGGQSQLTCIGSAVPTPDWSSYLADPTSVPEECVGAVVTPTGDPTGQRRNVTLFEHDFGAPKVWRSTFGASRRFFERYSFNVDAQYAYGVNQTGARDLNLAALPQFTLTTEGGRPVYVPPAAIIPRTGATTINASRLHPEYGAVTDLMSDLHSTSAQVTTTVGGLTLQGIMWSASYTFLRSRDQQNGFGVSGFGGGTTAGDPNLVQWGTSDRERRHQMLGTLTFPARQWLDITAIGRLTSGQRYTPMVSGDVNGDGSRNDRAYIYDPASASIAGDTALVNGMTRLLAGTSGRARDCLESQMNGIASRNSCSTPWTPALDVQFNFKPSAFGLERRLTLSLQLQNALVGLDQLLHGNNLHGWGQPILPDRTLLYVRGFDANAQRYVYQVNEHFGDASGRTSAYRIPFQVGLQGRLTLGQDPSRQQVRQIFGGPNGQRLTKEDYKARLQRLVPNPFLATIALNDSLKLALTPEQTTRLRALSDTLTPKVDALVNDIAEMLAGAGANPDPQVIFARMSGKTNEGRKLGEQAIGQLQSVLTPEQWAKLPTSVKTMPGGRGAGFGGGRGERRGPGG